MVLLPTALMSLRKCSESKQVFNTLVKLEQNLTIERSLSDGKLMIYEGKKLELVREIIRVVEFFLKVTGKEMEDFQVQILAGDLYEKFKHDTLEDIILMFKMARQGDFGKVYKLDNFEVMDWANRYLEKKSEERERILRSKKEPKNEEPQKGEKYFHELPQELQDKFNQIGGISSEIIPRRASDLLAEERFKRSLDEKKKKPLKFKRYI